MGVRNNSIKHGLGVLVACTTTSGSTRVNLGDKYTKVKVVNAGSVPAHMAFSAANDATAAVPTTTGAMSNYTIGAGSTDVWDVGQIQYVAGITGSSTASVFVHGVTDGA